MEFAEILLNHQQVRGDPEPEPPGRMRRESGRLLHAIFYSIIWIEHILQSEESQIRGVLGSSVTLPCTYSSDVLYTTCWGQGICTWLGCNGELFPQFVATSTISPGLSSKYELRGDLQKGNVSLTIKDLEKTDEGVYCCRIMVTGPGNDLKTVLNLIAVSPPDETTVCCGTINATTEQPTKAPWQVSFPFKHQVDAAVIQDIVNKTRSFKEKACNKSAAGGPDKKDTQAPLPDIVKKSQRFKDKACNSSDAGIAMEALSNFSQSVLASPKEWGRLEKKQQQAALGHLLQAMKVAIADAALNLLRNNKMRYSSPTIVVHMASLQKDKVTERSVISLNANNSVLVARSLSLLGQDDHENVLLTFLAYGHLETVVEPMLAQEGGRNVANVKFKSKVVTVIKVGGQRQGLSVTLNITFSVKEPGDDGKRNRLCGTWMGNGWATQQESSSNKTHATCVYNTLSSFALLLAQYKMKDPVHSTTLRWITLLVLPVSLLLLLLSVATFFWCRAIRGPYTLIRAHLCLNLFLAELLLLITMFKKGPSMVCALVVGSLHYLLLVAFSWMLLEAVHLWLMVLNLKVVNFTRTRVMKRRYMYPAAYLCPALVVAVAASVNPDGYWRHDGCWLSLEKGFIWSLLGPVCFVVLVNTVLFVMIIWILRNSMTALNADVSTIKDSRIRTFKAMAQFVVLGCSWVIGLFQLNEDTIVLSYIFTIVNSAQGVFIFLVHCLLNQQVRREYSNWFNRMCRRKKAEAADTSSPIVISQVTVSKTVDSQTTQSDIQWVNMGSEG